MTRASFVLLVAIVPPLELGCAPGGAFPDDAVDEGEGPPSFGDWLDEKNDTAYVGNRAVEIEAALSGRVRVRIADRDEAQLEEMAQALVDGRADPDVTLHVTQQVKYARNGLKQHLLNLNLEGGRPTFTGFTVLPGGLDLEYRLTIESLIKIKDLESQDLTPDDMIGRTIDVRVPLRPEGAWERAGIACATDPHTGREASPDDVREDNFFYYFDPDRAGCPLEGDDLVELAYEIQSSFDAPTVYPEYDRLVEDGHVSMVMIFGQITHGGLGGSDQGWIAFRRLTWYLDNEDGFDIVEEFPDDLGHRMERTYPGGLVATIDMYSPVGFADRVPRTESGARFREAVQTHELVYYYGHAFYGSLDVLDDRETYPEDTYQVIFMDACWSYAYYTKQVFRNRVTEEDPDGYVLADVVNNTEPGITGSEETSFAMWMTLLSGAAAVHDGEDASKHSWNLMIEYMNRHAEYRARGRRGFPNPEIYGVSGARTNVYQPIGGGER